MKITKEWIYVNLTNNQAEHMGAVWNDRAELYRLPNTIGVLKELKKLGYNVDDYLKKKEKARMKFMSLKRRKDAEGKAELRPYQRVDVQYLKRLGSAGIFNEMRTGKTPTTLTLIEEKEFNKVIIVVPATLILNWEEEVKQWTSLKLLPIMGAKKKRMKLYNEALNSHNGLIVSYETLRNDINEVIPMVRMQKVDALIVDEAHRLRSFSKNPNKGSKVSKALMKLRDYIPFRYALTGTPVVKEGEEIWKILHFLYPERFPGYWQFLERYFEIGSNGFGREVQGYKRKDELQEIISLISVNRKRSEVMTWLPKKQYQSIKLEMNSKQRKVYESVAKTFEYEDIIDAPNDLARLTRLRQIATAPSVLVDDVPNEKEKFILEWIADHPNEKVLIFSTMSSYLEQLHEKIPESELITGKVSKQKRNEIVKKFQNTKDCKVILANIKAAGTGLTLDKAETVIFLDKEFNPSDNEQAEDRIIPTSKERNHSIHVISLVMNDTVDEMINGLLAHKYDITKVINNGGLEALDRLWKQVKDS